MVLIEKHMLTGKVKDLGELQYMCVSGTDDESVWNEMIREYHYLGLGHIIGQNIKYLVLHDGAAIAAIGYNRASKSIGVREEYIGWDAKQRMSMLKHVANNMRYLIMPNIKIKNLASHILARGTKEARAEWERRFGEKLYAVESFVDGERYKGTCYLAANWQYLGDTKGYGKVGSKFVYHGRRKKYFIHIIDRKAVERIRLESNRGKKKSYPKSPAPMTEARREKLMMLEAMTDWSPGLLKEAGVTAGSVRGLGKELTKYLSYYGQCFARSEGRDNMLLMMKGLLSDLERKSIEPIALRYSGPERVRSLQVYMGAEKAVDDGFLHVMYKKRLAQNISEDDGMINVDGSDFIKKGKKSVGVSRQYCGPAGKTENCQAGVFMGYSSGKGYGLIDRRLYMPESWMLEEAKEKRDECRVPDDIRFKTKVELASEMISDAIQSGLFKSKWIGADSFFGRNKGFLDGIPAGHMYFVDVPHNTYVYRINDTGGDAAPSPEAVKLLDIAADEGAVWNRVKLAEGVKGPILADEKCERVYERRDDKPGGGLWLYIRRYADGKIKCALSNAPADMSMKELRRAATMRWPIEQCFEECKSNLGMDHYEGRSWPLWHRHMLYVFIAHLFLVELRLRFKKNGADIDVGAGPHVSGGIH